MKIFGWDKMVSNKDNYEYNPIYIHEFIIYATLFKIIGLTVLVINDSAIITPTFLWIVWQLIKSKNNDKGELILM